MRIFKSVLLIMIAAASLCQLSVQAAPPAGRGEHEVRSHGKWDKNSPEAKAAMKRRYEIMILMQAYKIVPEELKAGIKAEIMRRLHEDYVANRKHRENIINFMENELARLRSQQEADTQEEIDSIMEAEFERLNTMPIDMRNTPDNRKIQGRVQHNGK